MTNRNPWYKVVMPRQEVREGRLGGDGVDRDVGPAKRRGRKSFQKNGLADPKTPH